MYVVYVFFINEIKSVSIVKELLIMINVSKYFRDFKQELDLNYFGGLDFSIALFNDNYNNNNRIFKHKKLNVHFCHYLAGLIESDGSIIIPKENSKNTPTISITFHIDDKPLALCICKKLGYGSLEIIEMKKAVKIHIRGKYSILNMISLMNGKFRTPKIEKLEKLILYINNKWIEQIVNPIIILSVDNSPLNSNSWFAGFSEGDANFNINITWPNEIYNKYGQIRLTFEIVQTRLNKEHLEKYEPIMNKIALFCNAKLGKHSLSQFDRSGKQDAWRARITNKKGASILVNYFEKYPLWSSKYLNYLNWRDAYFILIINKEHIVSNKLDTYNKIKEIKEKMNTKRRYFNWDHLNKFFNDK
jgi:hypothetical protein